MHQKKGRGSTNSSPNISIVNMKLKYIFNEGKGALLYQFGGVYLKIGGCFNKLVTFYSFHYIALQFCFMFLSHIYTIQIKVVVALTSSA